MVNDRPAERVTLIRNYHPHSPMARRARLVLIRDGKIAAAGPCDAPAGAR
jgi:hypothetical protein